MRWTIPGLLIGILIVAASIHVSIGEETAYTCMECGLIRHHRVLLGSETLRDQRTTFTEWHDQRLGVHRQHQWMRSEGVEGFNFWRRPTYRITEGVRLEYATTQTSLGLVLGRLQAVDLDLAFHRHFTHEDPRHRAAAGAAGHCFNPKWSDDRVRTWWSQTEAYLNSPHLWGGPFRSGTHPIEQLPQWQQPAAPPPQSSSHP